ncbi:MAG: alpha/beta hydrolase [Actinomycetota bacterium]|nr:alpha/beta hydrolase [Actinomycetota bacterium]
MPAAKSIVFEDCGHVPQFEHPDKTHEVLREFFDAAYVEEQVNA